MTDSRDIRRGRHVVCKIHVHLVFVPKYRCRVFAAKHLERMRSIFEDVCRDFGAALAEMNGAHDHVHLLVEYPPQVAISNLVNSLKGVSSRLLRKEFPDLRHRYYNGVLWSPSYFAASCGGARLSIVKQYVVHLRSPG